MFAKRMKRYAKSAVLVLAGIAWFAVALGCGFVLLQYLAEGAGLQVFGFSLGVSSTGVLIGLARVVGFAAAATLSFAIGAGLCAHGLVPAPNEQQKTPATATAPVLNWRHVVECLRRTRQPETGRRCVLCRIPLDAPVEICPECGWTQPEDAQ